MAQDAVLFDVLYYGDASFMGVFLASLRLFLCLGIVSPGDAGFYAVFLASLKLLRPLGAFPSADASFHAVFLASLGQKLCEGLCAGGLSVFDDPSHASGNLLIR